MKDVPENRGWADWLKPQDQGDQKVTDLSKSLFQCRSLTDLRTHWDHHKNDFSTSRLEERSFKQITARLVETLHRLGLDVGADDERIAFFHKAIQLTYPHSQTGYYSLEGGVMNNYFRILAGCDPRHNHRLTLLPFDPLVPQELLPTFVSAAFAYTEGREYTVPSYHPRKALRTEYDPRSIFWHFGIFTDDFPGRTVSPYHGGPNISVSMPTGIISRESFIHSIPRSRLERDSIESNSMNLPDDMDVQDMQLGRLVDRFHLPVDTQSGIVRKYLTVIAMIYGVDDNTNT